MYNKKGFIYITEKDDGGTAKNSDRLIRRRRSKLFHIFKYPIGICFVGVMYFIIVIISPPTFTSSLTSHNMDDNSSLVKLKTVERPTSDAVVELKNSIRARGGAKNTMIVEDDDHHHNHYEERTTTIRRHKSVSSYHRWAKDSVLPPTHDQESWAQQYLGQDGTYVGTREKNKIYYRDKILPWEKESKELPPNYVVSPKLDYTKHDYTYPEQMDYPTRGGSYPPLETLGTILRRWPQTNIDNPPSPFVEKLQHFDYNDPEQLVVAERYRDAEFPFKLTNVPELLLANEKWTDEYLSYHFDRDRLRADHPTLLKFEEEYGHIHKSKSHSQRSDDSFFAFFYEADWNLDTMGDPPEREVDFTFERWASHARYADAVGILENETHYYYQSGAPKQERFGPKSKYTMISVDLPSFSDPEPNFISFHPRKNQGVQCRFGERGVTAATHWDSGRNMVGMITGAKRYILAPPKECSKLGIVTLKNHPVFRHSLLNFDHINILDSDESDTMTNSEREWLEIARGSYAIDTVVKAGEVLYIPSSWFHYITSLQKSTQCNVRSGKTEGSPEFGGQDDVEECDR